jgi:hypothetical protein
MHEFENIAFLDQQKTGSTTIARALRKLLAEKEIYFDTHGAIPAEFDKAKKCFISVREPLSIYISLFKFGAGSKKGSLYNSLRKKELSHYYEPTLGAFETWLEFVLDPANARTLNYDYADYGPVDCAGILTFRFLDLCLPKSRTRLKKVTTREKLERVLGRKHVYSEYVRTESLYEDLFGVLRHWESDIKLEAPLTTPEDMIAKVKTQNVSRKIKGLTPDSVSPRLRNLVQEREWLIYRTFGYDQSPNGLPTSCIANSAASR